MRGSINYCVTNELLHKTRIIPHHALVKFTIGLQLENETAVKEIDFFILYYVNAAKSSNKNSFKFFSILILDFDEM